MTTHRVVVKYINDNTEISTPWVAGSADVRRHFLPGEYVGSSVGYSWTSENDAFRAAREGIPKGCKEITRDQFLEWCRGPGHRTAKLHSMNDCPGCARVKPKFRKAKK